MTESYDTIHCLHVIALELKLGPKRESLAPTDSNLGVNDLDFFLH